MDSRTAGVRLRSDVWERYATEAHLQEVSVSTYLRLRLERSDQLGEEIAALRKALERRSPSTAHVNAAEPHLPAGVVVEVLLLLRSLAGPQKSAVAQKEVERRGLGCWT